MGTSLCPQNLPRTCPLGNAGHRQKSPSWTCMTAGRLRRATRTRDDLYKERLKLQRVCKAPEGVRVSLSFFMHTPFLEKTVEPEVKTKSLTHPEANELFLLPLQTSRAHSPPRSESALWRSKASSLPSLLSTYYNLATDKYMYGKPYGYCLQEKEINSHLVHNRNRSCVSEVFACASFLLSIAVLVQVVFSLVLLLY